MVFFQISIRREVLRILRRRKCGETKLSPPAVGTKKCPDLWAIWAPENVDP